MNKIVITLLALVALAAAETRVRREDTGFFELHEDSQALYEDVSTNAEDMARLGPDVASLLSQASFDATMNTVDDLKEDAEEVVPKRVVESLGDSVAAAEQRAVTVSAQAAAAKKTVAQRKKQMENAEKRVKMFKGVVGTLRQRLASLAEAASREFERLGDRRDARKAELTAVRDAYLARIEKLMDNMDEIDTKTRQLGTKASATVNTLSVLKERAGFGNRVPIYRYNKFYTYAVNYGWSFENKAPELMLGLTPQQWRNGARVWEITENKDDWRAFFTQTGRGGHYTKVAADCHYYTNTGDDTHHVVMLFRVKNNTPSNINWQMCMYYTNYGGRAYSITLNGDQHYSITSTRWGNTICRTVNIPANRVSSVIISASAHQSSSWSTMCLWLGFYSNTLNLPVGLELIDDLDYAMGGWDE